MLLGMVLPVPKPGLIQGSTARLHPTIKIPVLWAGAAGGWLSAPAPCCLLLLLLLSGKKGTRLMLISAMHLVGVGSPRLLSLMMATGAALPLCPYSLSWPSVCVHVPVVALSEASPRPTWLGLLSFVGAACSLRAPEANRAHR